MKGWWGRILVGLGVCLLLALRPPAPGKAPDHPPCLAGGGWWVEAWEPPVLASSLLRPLGIQNPRLLSLWEALALAWLPLTEGPVAPPGWDTRGPPGRMAGTSVVNRGAAGQAGSPEQGRGTSEFRG